MDVFTSDEVRQKLRQAACDAGSQKALAERIGVSSAFLSDIILAKREPSGAVLSFLGLRRAVRYESI